MLLRVWNKSYHGLLPEGAVYVGSRRHSKDHRYFNPFVEVGQMSDARKKWALQMFERNVLPHLDCNELKGKHLICSCDIRGGHRHCHAELLLLKANGGTYGRRHIYPHINIVGGKEGTHRTSPRPLVPVGESPVSHSPGSHR